MDDITLMIEGRYTVEADELLTAFALARELHNGGRRLTGLRLTVAMTQEMDMSRDVAKVLAFWIAKHKAVLFDDEA